MPVRAYLRGSRRRWPTPRRPGTWGWTSCGRGWTSPRIRAGRR
ncbi:hypothetical protein NKG94_22070 [Micromonospora sp. M12]